MNGRLPWEDIPDEYEGGDEDALSHSFSLDYLGDGGGEDFMNDEAGYHMESELDPLEQLIAEEDQYDEPTGAEDS